MATILVVDDELGIRGLLSEILSDEGHTVSWPKTPPRHVRERLRPDLVLLDIWMPDVDGISLLKEWSAASMLTMPVIMMSGHGTIDTAVEATKHGASAFLEKPITLQKLLRAVEQALAKPAPRSAAAPALGGLRSELLGAPMMDGHLHPINNHVQVLPPPVALGPHTDVSAVVSIRKYEAAVPSEA
jgi:DNA-binding NtrC family response regulator